MASLYPKKKSPFWYIEYADPLTGRPRNQSTKLRRDDPEQTRKARQLCAQHTANELGAPTSRSSDHWEWVPAFLAARYSDPLTLKRSEQIWFALSTYLTAKRITAPRLLLREHCIDYISWRTGPEGRRLGLRKAQHNTALLELKFLSVIMREAVHRGKTNANPVVQLGIGRVATKQKPEIKEKELLIIERQLETERGKYQHNEAMRIAWAIAMRQSRRLRETCVDIDDVDLDEQTITFRIKGGRKKTKLLHPDLVPLFRKLKKQGRRFAYEMPPNWSKVWKYFFKRCGLPHLTFHSTRVTVVNILRRKRVDPRTAKEFVDHSSVIVHEGYERWRPDDQADAVNALSRGVVDLSGVSARLRSDARRKRSR